MRRGPEFAAAAALAAALSGGEVSKAQAETHPAARTETVAKKSEAGHHKEKHRPTVTVDLNLEGSTHGSGALVAAVGAETHVRPGKPGEALVGGAVLGGVKFDKNGVGGGEVGAEASILFKTGKAPIYVGPKAGGVLDLRPGMTAPGGEAFLGVRAEAHLVGDKLVLGADVKGVVGKGANVPGAESDHNGVTGGAIVVGGVGGRF